MKKQILNAIIILMSLALIACGDDGSQAGGAHKPTGSAASSNQYDSDGNYIPPANNPIVDEPVSNEIKAIVGTWTLTHQATDFDNEPASRTYTFFADYIEDNTIGGVDEFGNAVLALYKGDGIFQIVQSIAGMMEVRSIIIYGTTAEGCYDVIMDGELMFEGTCVEIFGVKQ